MVNDKYDMNDLLEIMERLRGENGCVWDREQTHKSIKQCLIEETYEVLEAIDKSDDAMMIEELGDVLLQIVFHAQIAKEEKRFDINDVTDGIVRKMILRHPHVFGDTKVENSDEVLSNWDKIKKEEKSITSYSDSINRIPSNLPALIRAAKVQQKASKAGFDWDNVDGVFRKIEEELNELRSAVNSGSRPEMSDEFGDLLFSVVNLSRFIKEQPELALTASTEKFIRRFSSVEELINKSGKKFEDFNLEELDNFWNSVKECEK